MNLKSAPIAFFVGIASGCLLLSLLPSAPPPPAVPPPVRPAAVAPITSETHCLVWIKGLGDTDLLVVSPKWLQAGGPTACQRCFAPFARGPWGEIGSNRPVIVHEGPGLESPVMFDGCMRCFEAMLRAMNVPASKEK